MPPPLVVFVSVKALLINTLLKVFETEFRLEILENELSKLVLEILLTYRLEIVEKFVCRLLVEMLIKFADEASNEFVLIDVLTKEPLLRFVNTPLEQLILLAKIPVLFIIKTLEEFTAN